MRQNPDFVARQIGSEFVLVPVSRKTANLEGIFTLNEVGGRIWTLLGEGLDEATIAGRLTDEYEVDEATALADVHELVGQLAEVGATIEG